MKAFFRQLFEYNHYSNTQLVAALDQSLEVSVKLFSHIMNAHQIWNNRIEPREPLFKVWDLHTVQECKEINQRNYEHTLFILDNYDPEKIYWKDKNGRDLLFHVINHSTYHRAQIATDFRKNGFEPLKSDYILFQS